MNNGLHGLGAAAHAAVAAADAAAAAAAQDPPGSPSTPVNQPIVAQMPGAPQAQSYPAYRAALREQIAQRAEREGLGVAPSFSLQQVGAQGLPLPAEVLNKITALADTAADVQHIREVSKEMRLSSLSAMTQVVVQDPADLAMMIARYPQLECITLVGDVFSDDVLQQLAPLENLLHVDVVTRAPMMAPALPARHHLPKSRPLDPDVERLADCFPTERIAERNRILATLRAMFTQDGPAAHRVRIHTDAQPVHFVMPPHF